MSNSGSTETRSKCEACGEELIERLPNVIDPQTRESFAIVGCPSCGLGKTVPQPDDLSPYYGPAYHGGRHGFTARYCVNRRLRFLRQVAGPGAGRRLLDVGCGDGAFLVSARGTGWEVAGTETNPSLARAAGIEVCTALDDATKLRPFACVTAWHSLEHMRSPRELVRDAVQLLERRGPAGAHLWSQVVSPGCAASSLPLWAALFDPAPSERGAADFETVRPGGRTRRLWLDAECSQLSVARAKCLLRPVDGTAIARRHGLEMGPICGRYADHNLGRSIDSRGGSRRQGSHLGDGRPKASLESGRRARGVN